MNKYGTILTDIGAAAMANAAALGSSVEITQIAVGDGNGGYYQPQPVQTALKREVWRGKPSSVEISGASPNIVIINAVIPPDTGGWTMREVGIFNAANQLLAVGNMPDQQKIISTQGTSSEFYMRLELAVSNAENVEITVDPYLILATKRDIETHNTSATAHKDIRQIIITNLDASKTYADTQIQKHDTAKNTHPDIREAITTALAEAKKYTDDKEFDGNIVVDGIAGHNTSSTAHADIRTSITEARQELTTHDGNALSHNDIRAKLLALETAINSRPASSIPAGMIAPFGGAVAPDGWILCDGRSVSRTAYPKLFEAIKTNFGATGGSAYFNVPDFRGKVPGGVGGSLGSLGQSGGVATHALGISEMPSHSHNVSAKLSGNIWPVNSSQIWYVLADLPSAASAQIYKFIAKVTKKLIGGNKNEFRETHIGRSFGWRYGSIHECD